MKTSWSPEIEKIYAANSYIGDESMPDSAAELKDYIMGVVSDTVGGLMYYDRKEDEDLPCGVIELMISEGHMSIDEIVEAFRKELNS